MNSGTFEKGEKRRRLPAKRSTRFRRFVNAYVETLNGTKAAIVAGYSEHSAHSTSSRLLKKTKIQEMIASRLAESELSSARTLREIGRVAYADVGEIFDENGNLLSVKQLPEHVRAAIASVKVVKKNLVTGDGETDDIHEVKLWDKMKALEMAAKYLKLLDGDRGDTNVTIQVSWMNNSEPKPNEVINITPETQNPLTE